MTMEQYVNQLFSDSQRVELRHINGAVRSVWTDSPEQLIETAAELDTCGNIYTSLNRPVDGWADPLTNDSVTHVTRIFLDFDPNRPTGMASTDAELALAQQRACEVMRHLQAHRWPQPAIGMSGNGAHLHYRCAMMATPTLAEHFRSIYKGLAERFSDEAVSLDVTVRNPGRICCLYGTTKRKGSPTDQRPHRQASIRCPQSWHQVRPRQIQTLAEAYARKPETAPPIRRTNPSPRSGDVDRGDWRTLDIASLFAAHGKYIRSHDSNMHYVRCPWEDEHTTVSPKGGGDTVIFDAAGSTSGYPGFFCQHSHCEGRYLLHVAQLWDDVPQYCTSTYTRYPK